MSIERDEDGNPKWFSYMKKDRKKQINEALTKNAATYNIPIEALQLGSDWSLHDGNMDDGSFKFTDDLEDGTAAQTRFKSSWFGMLNQKPSIELNNKFDLKQVEFDHEFDHTTDQYLAALNEDGTVNADWGKGGGKTLTGYKYHDEYDGKMTPYYKDYTSLNSFEERLPFFTNRFLNNPDNKQRAAYKRALANATGHVLSDDLLHADSLTQSTKSGVYYQTDPREKWANALNTLRAMKKLEEDQRFTSKGYERTKVGTMTDDEIQEMYPDQGITSVHTYKDVFNPKLDGAKRIRKETFDALMRMMEENKINEAGNGFAMLKTLDGQIENSKKTLQMET